LSGLPNYTEIAKCQIGWLTTFAMTPKGSAIMKQITLKTLSFTIVVMALCTGPMTPLTLAQTDATTGKNARLARLADDLQNPVADLISVPLQNRWDHGIGPANATLYTGNVQPVIPFRLSKNWTLITRTIVPVIHAQSPLPGGSDQTGLGDILQTFFFSPKKIHGWILGGGPVFKWPTASKSELGSGKYGVGPSIIVFHQAKGLTYGMLDNHVWSFAGWSDKKISATFLQPVFAYRTKTFTTFLLIIEANYNWVNEQWITTVGPGVGQMLKIGSQPIALNFGWKFYTDSPAGGPDHGVVFQVTFPFPK
jgi:hypothetical protein